jgi:protein transport protein SEC31
MHTKPPTAWNDPPLVTPKIRAPSTKEPSTENMPQFFQPSMPVAPLVSNQYYYPQPVLTQQAPLQNDPVSTYQPPLQQQQQFGASQMAFNQPASSASFQPQQPIVQQQAQQQPQPQPQAQQAIEKGPIPAEHQILKTVFDALLTKCLSANNQPTVKRKLDDVSKKLDVLYDKLRDNTV